MHAAVPSLAHVLCSLTRQALTGNVRRARRHAHADVEFNLLYDRGVKFGLTPQSVERVLGSSPPLVAFKYKQSAERPAGSPEAARGASTTINQSINRISRSRSPSAVRSLTDARFSSYCGFFLGYVLLASSALPY